MIEPIERLGYPSLLALSLAAILVLIPLEFGIMLWSGKKKYGKFSLRGMVLYREKIPLKQYLIWVPVIVILFILVYLLTTPISTYVEAAFTWFPDSLRLNLGLDGNYSKNALVVTYTFAFFSVALFAPVTEEYYFRGYLLPRMPDLGGWELLAHSALFALYHIWTPWLAITRTFAVLPLIYIVRKKRNIYLGAIAHCLLNLTDIILGVVFISKMGG